MRLLVAVLAVNSAFAVSASSLPPRVREQAELAALLRQGPLADWSRSWKNRDGGTFSRLCAEKTALTDWIGRRGAARENDGIREYAWKDSGGPKELARAGVARAAAAYLSDFSKIDDVAITPLDLSYTPGSAEAELEAGYDLRGRLKDGSLRTDRGIFAIGLRREASAKGTGWKIARILDRGMRTLEAKRPVFEDATAKVGLDGVERHPRLEAIRRGGYALAVADYDASGWPSVYVGGYGNGQLYRRGRDGVFKDVTREAGLGQDTLVKSAVFADFDRDGKTDLLVQRFVKEAGQELKFYRNGGRGGFVEANATVERKAAHDRAMSMTAGDFNGDGLTDLYVGYPGTRDFTDGRLDAPDSLAHQAVYMNLGEWKFSELMEASPPRFSAEVVRPHSALASDFDGDGRTDILVVDDRGNSSRIYLNGGEERFRSAELQLGLQNQGWGMVAVSGDFDRDQKEDVYFTNIDLSAGNLLVRLMEKAGARPQEHPGLARARGVFAGNRLYRANGDGSFRAVTESAGVGRSGEAPAGAAWVDYNNDGLLDLYVLNGLWSADPAKSYDDEFVQKLIDGAAEEPSADDNPVMSRLQRTGQSFGGYQRKRLYRNNGDGTFTEVGYVTGADRLEDGYVAATADFDKDGRADLILRNADPADLKAGFLPITVLHNIGKNGNKSLSVYARHKNGAPALGARVIVRTGPSSQSREIRAVEGAVQNEDMVLIGLGAAAKADLVEVRWPSGKVSRFEDVAAGRIIIDEGSGDLGRLTRLPAAGGAAALR